MPVSKAAKRNEARANAEAAKAKKKANRITTTNANNTKLAKKKTSKRK